MTYQLMASLLAAAGSGVRSVRVTGKTDGIFLRAGPAARRRHGGRPPSDAINLAAITGAPVLVAAELLELPAGPRQRAS